MARNHSPDTGSAGSLLACCGGFVSPSHGVGFPAPRLRPRRELKLLVSLQQWSLLGIPPGNSLHDPLRTVTVAVRILALRHVLIRFRIVEQMAGLVDDSVTRHTDDFRHTKLGGFRTFGEFAQHQPEL